MVVPSTFDWGHLAAPLRLFNVTRPTVVENLALDEILLEEVEADPSQASLRIWESPEYVVVLGRSNRPETEVHEVACRNEGVPVFRRSSGGGTVLLGPGCLLFSLALPLEQQQRSQGPATVTKQVMQRIADGLNAALGLIDKEENGATDAPPPNDKTIITVQGTSDLVWRDRKFSGNAQRWLKNSFLHHGTILYDFDLPRIGRFLASPSRQPDYRLGREHDQFVTNLSLTSDSLIQALAATWNACPMPLSEDLILRAKERASRMAAGWFEK